MQESETLVPTLQRLVLSEALNLIQVVAFPLKVEQAVFPETHPAPLVLQPVKKAAHSSWVVAVVL